MNERKPRIAVIPQIYPGSDNIVTRPGYMTEILAAGGLPMLLPPTEDIEDLKALLSSVDGLLMTGGQDLEPALYGEATLPSCGMTQPWRDRMEMLALEVALELDLPVFCICRGFQTLNVYLGGSLYQDIPSQKDFSIIHSMPQPTNRIWHQVSVKEGTPLYDLWQEPVVGVNSCHHQGVKRLGEGLAVMAEAPDGIIESFYMPDKRFVWGVQWHPELFYGADPHHRALFEAFVAACR